MKKYYIELKSGYIRFHERFELNWELASWAFPLSISFSMHYVFIQILFVSIIIRFK